MLKHAYNSSSSSSMSIRGSSPAPSSSFSVSTDISFPSSSSSVSISMSPPPQQLLPKSPSACTSLYSFESEEDSFPHPLANVPNGHSWRRLSQSSRLSLPEISNTVPLRVYAADLRPDIQFKTVGVTQSTTCEEVISALLAKCKVRFKDPRLFHLALEVTIRVPNGTDTKASIQLENSATPLPLAECYPKGQARFCLQMKRGLLVKVFDGSSTAGWQYKSIMISEKTTAGELVDILFQYAAPKSLSDTKYYSLHIEVDSWKRQLATDELIIPAQNIASRWGTPKLILGCQNSRISTSSLSANSISSIYDHFYSNSTQHGSPNCSETSSPMVIPRKRWRRSKSLSENPAATAMSVYQGDRERQLLQIQDLRRKPNNHLRRPSITDSVISSFAKLNSRVGKYECSESFYV